MDFVCNMYFLAGNPGHSSLPAAQVAPSSITTNSLIDACRTTEEPLWHMAVQLLMALPQSSRCGATPENAHGW